MSSILFSRSCNINDQQEYGTNLSNMLNNYATFVMLLPISLATQWNMCLQGNVFAQAFSMTLTRADGNEVIVKKKYKNSEISLPACEWKSKTKKIVCNANFCIIKGLAVHASSKNNGDALFVLRFFYGGVCFYQADGIHIASHTNSVTARKKQKGQAALGRKPNSEASKKRKADVLDEEEEEDTCQQKRKKRQRIVASPPQTVVFAAAVAASPEPEAITMVMPQEQQSTFDVDCFLQITEQEMEEQYCAHQVLQQHAIEEIQPQQQQLCTEDDFLPLDYLNQQASTNYNGNNAISVGTQ